jgi:hypothetical protein
VGENECSRETIKMSFNQKLYQKRREEDERNRKQKIFENR